MKVAYFTGLSELTIDEAPRPKPDRPDSVLLQVDRVGICGSDVHYYLRGRIDDQQVQYPATVGHECSGTVVQVGATVKNVKPGDRVAVDPAISCGTCDQCRAGRVNTCRNLQFMGCPGEALGAMAEYRVMPAENCFPIPDNMTLDQAALAEPLSIGLHAVRLAEIRPTAQVAVLGAGPIGLSVLLCVKASTPCTVYMTDLIDERLQAADACGADWIGNAQTDDVTAAILRQQPQGLDLVFECSGDGQIIDPAQQLLAPGGTLVLLGIPPTPCVSFDSHHMRRHELAFKNVRRQNACVAPVIQLISQGKIAPSPLLTHRFPLENVRDGFELVADYRDGVIKAMVELSSAE